MNNFLEYISKIEWCTYLQKKNQLQDSSFYVNIFGLVFYYPLLQQLLGVTILIAKVDLTCIDLRNW